MLKLAIISPVLPPSQSGQAIVLYRLLDGVEPNQYILISPTNYYKTKKGENGCSSKLPGIYYHIPHSHPSIVAMLLRMNFYHIKIILNVYIKKRIDIICEILKAEKCTQVIACTADLFDPYCAYMASKLINIPFYLYSFDNYICQWTHQYYHYFAEMVGPSIIKNAHGNIVPNNHLKSFYDTNFNVNAKIIHNPLNLCDYSHTPLKELDYSDESEIKIVYTGTIYEAQMDALDRLVLAISKIKNKKIRIHIFSSNYWKPVDNLNEFVIFHNILPLSKMVDIQKGAHILFLPLAFKSEYPNSFINSSSPGKMGEYLASYRPILVHAPPDSYVTWYFKKYNCGGVVDSMNIDALAKEITVLVNNEGYRNVVVKNARIRANVDFDINLIKGQFFDLLDNELSEKKEV